MDQTPLYPPAPPGIPPDLTRPTSRYRTQVTLTLLTLLLFVSLYLALVIGSGWLVYYAFVYPLVEVNRGTIVLKIGAIACSAMLFLFLLKGLFKHQKVDRSLYVEISEREQPELFTFIRQLARDTGAPFPKRIYLSPEVNASVFYDSSLLSLVLPVRKNLLIGLGLVNVLPLNEFKAVLAHEFGHFSQGSMRVGSYVYVANRIIADMVYGRDVWDKLLAEWCSTDIRIGVFGWVIFGIVWVLRKLLAGFFRLINFSHSALSRQMEFNADLVAVRVTGSDALVHALSRLEFADASLGQAMQDLATARDHQLHSPDLFRHQTQAASWLRIRNKDPRLGLPPQLPDEPGQTVRVFEPDKGGPPSMWASHPSNHDREQNAKRHYVRSPDDLRSPWLLFRDPQRVREEVTRRYYRLAFGLDKDPVFTDPQRVEAFIEEEHTETTYHARYHGLYDGRVLDPGDLDAVAGLADPRSPGELLGTVDRLFGPELEGRVKRFTQHQEEQNRLAALHTGALRPEGKDVEFRKQKYRLTEIPRLLLTVQEDIQQDEKELAELDREVFQAHLALARHVGPGPALADELLQRYRFHLGLQEMGKALFTRQGEVNGVLEFLSQNQEVQQGDWREVVRILGEARKELGRVLTKADDMRLPALRNLEAGQSFGTFLLDEDLVHKLKPDEQQITGEWINGFLRQMGGVMERIRRVHFKSLGGILALQERIEEAGREQSSATALSAS